MQEVEGARRHRHNLMEVLRGACLFEGVLGLSHSSAGVNEKRLEDERRKERGGEDVDEGAAVRDKKRCKTSAGKTRSTKGGRRA